VTRVGQAHTHTHDWTSGRRYGTVIKPLNVRIRRRLAITASQSVSGSVEPVSLAGHVSPDGRATLSIDGYEIRRGSMSYHSTQNRSFPRRWFQQRGTGTYRTEKWRTKRPGGKCGTGFVGQKGAGKCGTAKRRTQSVGWSCGESATLSIRTVGPRENARGAARRGAARRDSWTAGEVDWRRAAAEMRTVLVAEPTVAEAGGRARWRAERVADGDAPEPD